MLRIFLIILSVVNIAHTQEIVDCFNIFDEEICYGYSIDKSGPQHFIGNFIIITASDAAIKLFVPEHDQKLASYIPLIATITYSVAREIAQGSEYRDPVTRDMLDVTDIFWSIMGSIIPHLVFNNLILGEKHKPETINKELRINVVEIN